MPATTFIMPDIISRSLRPGKLEDLVFFDLKILTVFHSAQRVPSHLVVTVLLLAVVTVGEVDTTMTVRVAVVTNRNVSTTSEHRPVRWNALDSLLRLHQSHLLLQVDRQQTTFLGLVVTEA